MIRKFKGPKEYQDFVVSLLKRNGVPGHSASVYEHVHDTGYPGLVVPYTYVDLYISDDELERKIAKMLEDIGFKER
ncbi:MAG: hypothetical protein DRP11_02405 [Candidatus Aenigmatarchaeota archaeon]|nr:MAG: hypothetical protein DRP11_02405 [Candidatus Aenigmarchaeota archaeon]